MGSILFLSIAIIIAICIFRTPIQKKLFWVIGSILFFPKTIILSLLPFITFPRFIVIVLLVDFIFKYRRFREFKDFPLRRSLIFLLLCFFSIGLTDNRITPFLQFYRPTIYFVENFFVLFLAFSLIKSIDDLLKFYTFLLRCLLICAFYGIVIKVIGTNVYTSFISLTYNTVDFGNWYATLNDKRQRISSFTWHPIYYGLILSFGISIYAFITYSIPLKKSKKVFYFFIFAMLAVNLFLTNSRTPLLSLVGGISVFFVFALGLQRKLNLFFISLGLAAAVITISPNSFKIVGDSIDTFSSKGADVEGSSVQMRQAQLLASFVIFAQSPIFGNGFNYITEGLGYTSELSNRKSDQTLGGFESYFYKLLIEQGLIGILGNIIFFYSLFRFLLKTRRSSDSFTRKLVYFTIAITVTFILFIFGTGDMESFTFFMLLLGANIKAITLLVNYNNKEQILESVTEPDNHQLSF